VQQLLAGMQVLLHTFWLAAHLQARRGRLRGRAENTGHVSGGGCGLLLGTAAAA